MAAGKEKCERGVNEHSKKKKNERENERKTKRYKLHYGISVP